MIGYDQLCIVLKVREERIAALEAENKQLSDEGIRHCKTIDALKKDNESAWATNRAIDKARMEDRAKWEKDAKLMLKVVAEAKETFCTQGNAKLHAALTELERNKP